MWGEFERNSLSATVFIDIFFFADISFEESVADIPSSFPFGSAESKDWARSVTVFFTGRDIPPSKNSSSAAESWTC